jgi:general secretion pathway protein D
MFRTFLFSSIAIILAASTSVRAQTAPTTAPADELVAMDFPADGVDLSVLADVVTRELHIPILYDEQVKGKRVIIRVPVKVPERALMGILQSALRLKQLALVDAEEPGWKQIVPAPNLAGVAKAGGGGAPNEGPITQLFILNHGDPTKVVEIIRPFLTQPGGFVQAEQGQKVLIVSDYASVVHRVESLIQQLDEQAPPVDVRFVPVKEAEATQLVTAVSQLINNRESYQWGNGAGSGISLTADERTNQIIVIAPPPRMPEVLDLIAGMDSSTQLQTRVYHLKTVTPDRVDRLIKSLIDASTLKRGYQAGVESDSQLFVVAATPQVHRRIEDLIQELDVPAPQSQNPMQFYKLKNTKAADVLGTISGLLGEGELTAGNGGIEAPPQGHAMESASAAGASAPQATAASNSPQASAQQGTTTNAGSTSASPNATPASAQARPSLLTPTGVSIAGNSNTHYVSPALPYSNESASSTASPGMLSMRAHNATVAADVNTNSIIVIAPPQVQAMYADLIKRLDERRPQVQIQCTIVTLDTSDGVSFGVDIGHLAGVSESQILTLSSFGVSTADPATGRLTPVNAPGGTFALLNPHVADVVIRALETNNRARFLSAPELLVNDNGKGKLESVAQEPFAVILDASSTQSVTSLGGLASAGTSISVEPHISEADYLQLAYSIELSNFTGTAQNGLPPPSQKNAVDSSVTIPDGYTIVVGGLTTKNYTTAVNTVPVLGDIPVIKYLFGTRSKNANDSTLFVFIKPVILRDDKFEDLKYLSSKSTQAAGVSGDFPQSAPIPMR